MTGPARHPIVPLPPRPPSVGLLPSSFTPGDDEVGLDGQPMAVRNAAGELTGLRWEEGIVWQPRTCPALTGLNDCAPAASHEYQAEGDGPRRYHRPVLLSAEYDCTAISADWNFYRTSAIEALLAGEARGAEAELWDGPLARAAIAAGDTAYSQNLWLTKYGVATDVTPTPGTGVTPSRAIALLEDFLAEVGTGAPGAIHLQRQLMPHVGVRIVGQQILTNVGNLLVPGVGYSGNGPATVNGDPPAAPAAGSAWIYATGLTTYRSGPVFVTPDSQAQAMDRSVNHLAVRAQRSSAGTWDSCAVGAVLVDLPA